MRRQLEILRISLLACSKEISPIFSSEFYLCSIIGLNATLDQCKTFGRANITPTINPRIKATNIRIIIVSIDDAILLSFKKLSAEYPSPVEQSLYIGES